MPGKGGIVLRISLYLILCLFTARSMAQNNNFAQIQRSGDSRGVAMGKTGTAYADDVSAIWSNPAGLAAINEMQLQVSFVPGIDDVPFREFEDDFLNHESVLFAIPFPEHSFTLACQVLTLDLGEYTYIADDGTDLGLRQAALWSYSLAAAASWPVADSIRLRSGVTVRYVDEDYSEIRFYGFMFDAGVSLVYSCHDTWLSAAVSIQNLGPAWSFEDRKLFGGEEDQPLSKFFRCGVAAGGTVPEMPTLDYLVSASYKTILNDAFAASGENTYDYLGLGMEAGFMEMLKIRLGYHFSMDKEDVHEGFTYGFALSLQPHHSRLPVGLGFSYTRNTELGPFDRNIFQASVSYVL